MDKTQYHPKAKPLPKRIDIREPEPNDFLEIFVGTIESIATSLLTLALSAADEPIPENMKAVLRAQAEDIGLEDEDEAPDHSETA